MRSPERIASPVLEARQIEVRGVVQGVGFRPFVWRLAERHGIRGRVRNASGVVEIHAEGPAGAQTVLLHRPVPELGQHRRTVLPERRPGTIVRPVAGDEHRGTHGAHPSESRMLVLGQHRTTAQLVDVEGFLHRPDGRNRHHAAQSVHPCCGRALGEARLEQRQELVTMLRPGLHVDEALVGGEARQVDGGHEVAEEPLLGCRDGDVPISRAEELERHHRGVARHGLASRPDAGREVPGRVVRQHREGHVVEIGFDVPTAAGLPGVKHPRQEPHHGRQPRGVVGQGQATLDGWVRRASGQGSPPGSGLDESIVAGQLPIGLAATVAGQGHADDALVDVPQVLPGQTQALGLVAAKVAEHRIGRADEPFEDLPSGLVLEVQHDASLVAVDGLEIEAVGALLQRRDVAADITAGAGILDLDDLGTQIGEEQRPERSGTELLDSDDPEAVEWARSILRGGAHPVAGHQPDAQS